MVASARRPVVPVSIHPANHSNPKANDSRQPRWVQDVLPFATSLILHLSILAVGFALYQVVTQVKPKERKQMTIPDSAMVARADLPISKPGAMPEPILLPELNPSTPGTPGTPDMKVMVGQVGGFPNDTSGSPNDINSLDRGFNDAGNKGVGVRGIGGPGTNKGTFQIPHGSGIPGAGIVGVRGKGKNVIFLCDASGSMLGVFGALKQQMKTSINQLDLEAGAEFNVIFFSDDNYFPLFKDGMQMATVENKAKAMEFVDNAVATGGTQPLPAIHFAMAEKPDLLFVLTDGFDQIANFDDVLNAFKNGNKDKAMQINCIFLESDPDPTLEKVLKQIADNGHGIYRKIRKEDM